MKPIYIAAYHQSVFGKLMGMTVPQIVAALSGIEVGPMSDTEYGILYVVAVPRFSHAAVTRLDLP